MSSLICSQIQYPNHFRSETNGMHLSPIQGALICCGLSAYDKLIDHKLDGLRQETSHDSVSLGSPRSRDQQI